MQIKPFAQLLVHISQSPWDRLSESLDHKRTFNISNALFKPTNYLYKKLYKKIGVAP